MVDCNIGFSTDINFYSASELVYLEFYKQILSQHFDLKSSQITRTKISQ